MTLCVRRAVHDGCLQQLKGKQINIHLHFDSKILRSLGWLSAMQQLRRKSDAKCSSLWDVSFNSGCTLFSLKGATVGCECPERSVRTQLWQTKHSDCNKWIQRIRSVSSDSLWFGASNYVGHNQLDSWSIHNDHNKYLFRDQEKYELMLNSNYT